MREEAGLKVTITDNLFQFHPYARGSWAYLNTENWNLTRFIRMREEAGELEVGFWIGLLIGFLIGFFLCAALMAWHALTYDFIDGEWKKREG